MDLFNFDLDRAEALLLERPRNVRGVGRTVSAAYHAVKHALTKPGSDLLYPVMHDSAFRWANDLIWDFVRDDNLFPNARVVHHQRGSFEIWNVGQSAHSRLTVANLKTPIEIERAVRIGGWTLVDDLGEWSDMYYGGELSPEVRAFVHGKKLLKFENA